MGIIEKTILFVKESLSGAESGHDWWHIQRVLNNSWIIAEAEHANLLVCKLGALLHDIADPKFHDGDEKKGRRIAMEFLKLHSVPEKQIDNILDIIENISFSKSHENDKPKSVELQVVQDADRLDAIGAIGIARAFSYGGYKNRIMYDPSIPPKKYSNSTEYRNSKSHTINHFHEKLLLLKDMMNTPTGKKMAENRHQFILQFLDQFHNEWDGKI